MLSDFVEPKWQRRRRVRAIHAVAVLSAVVAALALLGMFNQFGPSGGAGVTAERQLIAAVDLRVGNPAGAAERGEARARADIEAGKLTLQMVGAPVDPAEVAQARKRYGVAWEVHSREVTPLTLAYVQAYNKLMQEEIRRKHGDDAAERFRRLETDMMQREAP